MLTAKQQRFIQEYVATLNGARAAIRAGYSPKTARAIASENLKKPEIAAEVARRIAKLRKRSEVDRVRIIDGLARIAFANISGIFDERGGIKNPDDWPPEAWNGIKSVRYSEKLAPGPRGKKKRVSYRADVRMQDKLKALEALGEYLGMFQTPAPRR